ncbi:unnamed protein product [Trichobilharzia szidati]|nr:unnamed protein product [Trichobilharzia szidati]
MHSMISMKDSRKYLFRLFRKILPPGFEKRITYDDLKQEVEWEKQLLKADAMEESYEKMKTKLRDEKLREEARQFTYDKLTGNTQKDRDARADKEESKRIIDRLVAEEKKQIEKEAEERKRINERIRREYQEFIEQCEKDKAKKDDEIEFERQLLEEFNAYNNRLDERRQVKRDKINEQIKKQEAAAEVIAKLNEEHEKARYGFLDINESIENSLACLENLDWEKNQAEKRKQVSDDLWKNAQNLYAIKEKERMEEIEREREIERQILEKAQREKAELEAKKHAEKKRLNEEMKKYCQEHMKQNQLRLCKEKEEYEIYLKELEKHRAKVEAERQAMLNEYAEYLKNDACGDTKYFTASRRDLLKYTNTGSNTVHKDLQIQFMQLKVINTKMFDYIIRVTVMIIILLMHIKTAENSPYELLPLFAIKDFTSVNLEYGFPANFIGGIILTVKLNFKQCHRSIDSIALDNDCQALYIPSYCHFAYKQIDLLKNMSSKKNIPCNKYIQSELGSNDWVKQAYQKTTQIVNIQTNEIYVTAKSATRTMTPPPAAAPAPSPSNTTDNANMSSPTTTTTTTTASTTSTDISSMNKITAFFQKCGQNSENLLNDSFIPLCDWEAYLKLFTSTAETTTNTTTTTDYEEPSTYGELNTSSEYSALYWYYFCSITWSELQRRTSITTRHPLCPNPCSYGAGKCAGIPHVRQSMISVIQPNYVTMTNCLTTGLGLFENEYKCICEPGYSWSSDTKSCELEDPCIADEILAKRNNNTKDSDRLCDPKGTLRCIYTPYFKGRQITSDSMYLYHSSLNLHYSCICHPKYMGYRCDRLRNPCIENILPGRVSGNEACRTYLGNRCNPVNGSNYYTCTCIGDYKYSPEYPFYNCYGRKSICDNVICRNRGTCISSQDGYNFICQCQYGWGGRYCEEPDIRQWLPWESWTTCSAPLCGGQGWTSRKRRCRVPVNETTGLGKCSGNTLELRPCKTG